MLITICCNKSYVNMISLSKYLIACTYPSCDDVRWDNTYAMKNEMNDVGVIEVGYVRATETQALWYQESYQMTNM